MEIKKDTVVLTDDELRELTYDSISDEVVDDNRWEDSMVSIVKVQEEPALYARVEWQRGKTEMQENSYFGGEFPLVKELPTITITTDYDWFDAKQIKAKNSYINDNINSVKSIAETDAINADVEALKNVDFSEVLDELSKVNLLAFTPVMSRMKLIIEEYKRQQDEILNELDK